MSASQQHSTPPAALSASSLLSCVRLLLTSGHARLLCCCRVVVDGALFLHPKGAIVLSEKLSSSSASSALVLAVSSSRAARLKRSGQLHSRQQSAASSCSSSSVSLVDSLSLTSTSTFPAAYTAAGSAAAEQPAASSSSSSPSSKRSASASSLPTAAAVSSPAAHQRANTVGEHQMRGSLTPVQAASTSLPPSPLSPPTPVAADPHCPPTQRKAQRQEECKEREEGAEDVETRRLQPEKAEGEEDSEELTNTTLADASLPSSDDDSREKKWKQPADKAAVTVAAAAGGGGNDEDEDEDDDDIDDSQRGINCILSFLIDSIVASPATASHTREQLITLSPQQLLATYKLTLLPSPSVTALQAEAAALRLETENLRVAAKEAELAALVECRRQVKAARAEMELKFAEETRRTKAERKDKKERERERRRQAAVKEAAAVSASLSCIHSRSFHDASFDPTLSLTTDMLEPRTVTFTLAAHDLPTAAAASSMSPASVPHVLLALFSSSFSAHSLFSYIGQTERQPNAGGHIAFQRALTMREVRTWHAKDLLRVSAYDVTAAASSSARAGPAEAEERKDMLGQVLCDTYALFTSFTTERASYELLKAQEAVDAVLGYSEREISCSIAPQQQQGAEAGSAGRISIHAIITPALTVDAYPPCPKGVRRSSLAVETSLSLSLISEAADGGHHLSSSLAAISFQDPVSPILPLKAGKATMESGAGADSGKRRRASDGGSNSRPQTKEAVAVQCEALQTDEMATQTDTTAVMRRVKVDAATMTEAAVAAPAAVLAACSLPAVSIEPALTIVTASRREEISSPVLSPVHAMEALHGSNSSPASPQPLSTAGSPVTLQATLVGLSSVLSVPLPQAELRLSAVSQLSLQRIVSLLRRQYSFSLQWFLDTTSPSATPASSAPAGAAAAATAATAVTVSGARTVRKPIWNPSINPSSSLQPKLFSTIRLHSHWQPDHTASGCSVCLLSFGLLKRKHHCRLCGMTACDDCTRKSVELAEVGLTGQQRVCDLCEIVWSVGRGLKTVGEKEREPVREKEKEKETAAMAAPAAPAAAPAATKAGKKAEDSKKVEEAVPSLLATPHVQRTGKKGGIKKEQQAVLTASSSKRVTRSAAAKENVNVNCGQQPPGSVMKRKRQLTAPQTPAAGSKRA